LSAVPRQCGRHPGGAVAALLDRVLGFSAIALGWVVFALLALAPGRR
jgi:hypothetical protein